MPETMPMTDDPLSSVRLFTRLSAGERAFLASQGRFRRCSAGRLLQREGAPAGKIRCLLRGTVRVFRQTLPGYLVEVGRCHAGDIIGNGLIADGGHYRHTIINATDVELFELDRLELGISLTVASHHKVLVRGSAPCAPAKLSGQQMDRLIGQLDQLHQLINGSINIPPSLSS